jgi:hypothetical protein
MRTINRVCSKSKKTRRQTVQVKNALALPERAAAVAQCLQRANAAFVELFSDENFVTLLRAESMTTIPKYLMAIFEKATDGHEIC